MSLFRYLLLLFLGLLAACANNKPSPVDPTIKCSSPDTVRFSKQILPILSSNCSISGCHSGNVPAGNLNLEASVAYATLTNRRSGYVDVGNPRQSVLYSSLVSTSQPMPPTGKLDSCTLKLIELWMKQGALNN